MQSVKHPATRDAGSSFSELKEDKATRTALEWVESEDKKQWSSRDGNFTVVCTGHQEWRLIEVVRLPVVLVVPDVGTLRPEGKRVPGVKLVAMEYERTFDSPLKAKRYIECLLFRRDHRKNVREVAA